MITLEVAEALGARRDEDEETDRQHRLGFEGACHEVKSIKMIAVAWILVQGWEADRVRKR